MKKYYLIYLLFVICFFVIHFYFHRDYSAHFITVAWIERVDKMSIDVGVRVGLAGLCWERIRGFIHITGDDL